MDEFKVIPIHTPQERGMGLLKFDIICGDKKCLFTILRKYQEKNRKNYNISVVEKDGKQQAFNGDVCVNQHLRNEISKLLDSFSMPGKEILREITTFLSLEIMEKQCNDPKISVVSVVSNDILTISGVCVSLSRHTHTQGSTLYIVTTNTNNTNIDSDIVILDSEGKIHKPGDRITIDDKNYIFGEMNPPLASRYSNDLIKLATTTDETTISNQILTPDDLFNRLQLQYQHYIDFPHESWYYVFPIWVMGTYFFPIFDSYPYIELFGGPNTGKSKTMELSALMAYNGTMSVGISPSALFRGTEIYCWSIFLDEAYLFKSSKETSERKSDIISYLNCGYKKGTPVIKSEKTAEGKFKLVMFDTYCPKMIATNYETEEILATRQIQVIMRPALFKTGRGERQPKAETPLWTELRTQLLLFALKHIGKIKEIYDSLENEFELPNRDFELWKPLITIAKYLDSLDFAPDNYRQKALKEIVIETIKSKQEDITESMEFQTLKAVLELNKWDDYIPLSDIVEKVQEYQDRHQEWLNNRFIGKLIKKMNLLFKKRRIGRGREYKFKQENVVDMFDRYGFIVTDDNKIVSRSKLFQIEEEPEKRTETVLAADLDEEKLTKFYKDKEKLERED